MNIFKTGLRKLCRILPAAMLLLLCSCSAEKVRDLPVYTEEVHVTIPGMEGEVRLAFLSDLHVIAESDEISEGDRETVRARMEAFSHEGVCSAEQLPGWIDTVNASGADYCLFGGDLVDFASEANLSLLGENLEKLRVPWIYIRADHDREPFYLANTGRETCLERQQVVAEEPPVSVIEFDEFAIVAWDNSTSALSEEGMTRIREAAALGKPLILLTHVPILAPADASLSEASREAFDGRVLCWFLSSAYSDYFPDAGNPEDCTGELLDLIYAEDSPFTEILCGHLHFSWDGYVSPTVHQHVFSAAFARYMGMITVSGS